MIMQICPDSMLFMARCRLFFTLQIKGPDEGTRLGGGHMEEPYRGLDRVGRCGPDGAGADVEGQIGVRQVSEMGGATQMVR